MRTRCYTILCSAAISIVALAACNSKVEDFPPLYAPLCMDNVSDLLPASVFKRGDDTALAGSKDDWVVRIWIGNLSNSDPKFYLASGSELEKQYNESFQNVLFEKRDAADKRYQESALHGGDMEKEEAILPILNAGVVSSPVITADCALFGREAGENLADFFEVDGSYVQIKYLRRYEDFTIFAYLPEVLPLSLDKFLCSGTLLPESFAISIPSIFEGAPLSPVNFHLSLAVETISCAQFALNHDDGFVPTDKYRTLFTDFTLSFN